MSPVLILAAAWLLVIGYALVYVGYSNLSGRSVSFADAFGIKGGGTVGGAGSVVNPKASSVTSAGGAGALQP